MSFDGVNDTVYIANSTSLNAVSSGVTVAAWVYRSSTQTGGVSVVSREFGNTYYEHYYLGFEDGRYRWFVNTTSGYSDYLIGGPSPQGQWIQIVGTYDGTDVKLYVNGLLQFSTPHSGTFSTDFTGLTIGASHNDGSHAPIEAFNGKVDEVNIFAQALTAQEVLQVYQATGGTVDAPPSVTLTAPSAGASLQRTFTAAASASDDVAVAGVQFNVDGLPAGAEDTTAPYSASIDTTLYAEGQHTLTALARDSSGNLTSSAVVSVVFDNVALMPLGDWSTYGYVSCRARTTTTAAIAVISGRSFAGTVSPTSEPQRRVPSGDRGIQRSDRRGDAVQPCVERAGSPAVVSGDHWLSRHDAAGRLDLGACRRRDGVGRCGGRVGNCLGQRWRRQRAVPIGRREPGNGDHLGALQHDLEHDGDGQRLSHADSNRGRHVEQHADLDAGRRHRGERGVRFQRVHWRREERGARLVGYQCHHRHADLRRHAGSDVFSVGSAGGGILHGHSRVLLTSVHGDIEPSDHRVDAARNDDGYTVTGTAGTTVRSTTFALTVTAPVDTTAPTVPTKPNATAVSSSQINLSWTARPMTWASRDTGLYRNGTLIASTSSTSYQNTGLASNTTYSYRVSAYQRRQQRIRAVESGERENEAVG